MLFNTLVMDIIVCISEVSMIVYLLPEVGLRTITVTSMCTLLPGLY